MARLVRFGNGKYGARSGWFIGWQFLDLASPRFSWGRRDMFFRSCQGTREQAEAAIEQKRLASENARKMRTYELLR